MANALPESILNRFRGLALERLERIEAGWNELTRFPDDGERAAEVRRELHTLKGDARVVGFDQAASLCHKLEDLIFFAQGRSFQVPDNFDIVVVMAVRFLAILVRQKDGGTPPGIDLDGFRRQIDDVLRDAQACEAAAPAPPRRGTQSQAASIDRLSFATLHRFAEAATEVFIAELQASGRAKARLREVWHGLRDLIAALQTVPLTPELARRANSARELGRDLGKQVDLTVELEDVQVPPPVADALATALLHLVRNAVDHGLETAEVRERAGKPPAGQLAVRARQLVETVEVVVEDDGAGVDVERVRRRGVEMGLLPATFPESVPDRTVLELLFEPGFSTRREITLSSGRGVGLDAARTALSRLGGSIDLRTRAGAGTTVVMRCPLSSLRVDAQRIGDLRGVPIAVPAGWTVTVEAEAADALDPAELLAVEGSAPAPAVLRLRKDAAEVLVRGAAPSPAVAERLCPTGEYHPVEVVLLDGREGLLLHPPALANAAERAAAARQAR